MKNNQKGFGTATLGLMALLLLVPIVGFVGWKIYDSAQDKNSNAAKASEPKLYTDTAHRFTFNYPADWMTEFPGDFPANGPTQSEQDWTKISRPVRVKPAKAAKGNDVNVAPGCSAADIDQAKADKDESRTQQDLTINGYRAFYDRQEAKVSTESYVYHTYIILGKSDCLRISYREDLYSGASGRNATDSNVPGFKSIVESTRFSD